MRLDEAWAYCRHLDARYDKIFRPNPGAEQVFYVQSGADIDAPGDAPTSPVPDESRLEAPDMQHDTQRVKPSHKGGA